MTDIILFAILLLIAGGAGLYLYKAKKRGEHCVGCPYAKQCRKKDCNCSVSAENCLKN
ncbi:MAG: FeoB-associated Cys-rich membrane protein [Clostridia bacterium]|nr:FeoB-associated Cys-rich membrane protein [Clostridia bacterium]